MPIKYSKMFLLTGAVLGLVSGLLWFKIGEKLDDHLGNFTSWFIMPAILPLLVAGICLVRKFSRNTLNTGIVFVAIYYGFHWLPMLLVLLYFILFGIKF